MGYFKNLDVQIQEERRLRKKQFIHDSLIILMGLVVYCGFVYIMGGA